MAERKPEWPEAGDPVIARVETVTDYGAYARLDEFDKRGLPRTLWLPSSEEGGQGSFRREIIGLATS
jgi:hypothetical protein